MKRSRVLPLLTFVAVVGWAPRVFAQETSAHVYANGSVSILAGGGMGFDSPLAAGASLGITVGSGSTPVLIGFGVLPRFVIRHFVIQPSLGIAVDENPGYVPGTLLNVIPGIGLGGAFALTHNIALTPMAVFEFVYNHFDPGAGLPTSDTTWGRLVAELPLEIFIAPHAYFEPYVDIGAVLPFTTGLNAAFYFGFGFRIGARVARF